ncbi:MAG: acyltransferase family protein, partial [bacterium]|nr:acyltransferase family protein [bacterium]
MAKVNQKAQPKHMTFSEFFFNVRNIDKRDFGLDLVKVIAMFFVPSVHFFLYNGHYYYYSIGTGDTTGFILTTVVRDLFFICVPLFMLVSGALSYYHPADLSKRHYVKITPIIVNSLLIGLLVIWYKLAVSTNPADPTLTPYRLLQSWWSGNLPSYGWYVNMYVSLFVLMPIIDIAYNSLDSQKKKTTMMIACIVLSVLPMSVNKFKF